MTGLRRRVMKREVTSLVTFNRYWWAIEEFWNRIATWRPWNPWISELRLLNIEEERLNGILAEELKENTICSESSNASIQVTLAQLET